MITDATLERFSRHASPIGRPDDCSAICWCVSNPEQVLECLPAAALDCLDAFEILNREMNGPAPSQATEPNQTPVPRNLAYAISEILRWLRDCRDAMPDQDAAGYLEFTAWRIETAWNAVLAGDINDIREHLKAEEAARG